MKLRFYGADRCVTGSCHCLEVNGKHILVDCGLQQGRDEIDNTALPFHPGSIDVVLVTHAHIDHSGRIPMLIKNGFQGKIITTRLTADLLDIMLQDSAHIQEQDAEYQNRKNKRAGRPEVEPIYTVARRPAGAGVYPDLRVRRGGPGGGGRHRPVHRRRPPAGQRQHQAHLP